MKSTLKAVVCLTATLLVTACVIVRSVSIDTMTPEEAVGTSVRSPLKVFHRNGTITVFTAGANVTRSEVLGRGTHYSLDLSTTTPVTSVPLDSVMGIEAFRGGVSVPGTLLSSVLATAVVGLGAFAIACAADPKCFGSCPTIYAYEDGEEVLEAEAFSYSIAPLLEARDVDRLGARPHQDGVLRLEVRNEALETHYINHIEVLEARHAPGRKAYPNETGRVVSVGPLAAPLEVTDRDGRDHTVTVSAADGVAFATDEERTRAVTAEDYWDHVELTFPRPEGPTAALVLRMRNSLLNSILFYDLMLGSSGAGALNWLGRDINRIGEAVELGDWFNETMGLRVAVWERDGWKEVTRVGDTGPIAWKDMAVTLPVPDDVEELRIRLTFLADEWRIDYAALAADVERARVERLPLRAIGRIGEAPDDDLRARLSEPDDDYVVTSAGTAVYLEFETSAGVDESERTFFFSSQGYYTEWIRPDWIRTATTTEGFDPSAETVEELMERWLEVKDDFEQQFFETRIPVR